MAATRRSVLAGLLGLAATPALAVPVAPRRILGARADQANRFFVTGFDTDGGLAFDLPLTARGHGFAVRPDAGDAVLFARRPGDHATVLDPEAGERLLRIAAAPDRWFNGHGTYDAAGRRLFASETVASTGDGVIGVYEPAAGYRRMGEFRSGGLDPHDIRLLPDGRTLVVANGGILTHPDAPGVQLNLADMQPSLAYLDAASGALREEVRLAPALHQLGIRHLAVAADGTVAIAMQFAGPSMRTLPLVGMHRLGATTIEFLPIAEDLLSALRGYCGSAAIDASGTVLGVTSPRGSRAVFWHLPSRSVIGTARVADGCGIADVSGAGFLLGSGLDGMFRYRSGDGELSRLPLPLTARWDNHLASLPTAG
jgi:hypothetical protein